MTDETQTVLTQEKLVDLVYSQGLLSYIANAVNGCLLAMVFWGSAESMSLISWLALFLVVLIARWGLYRLYQDYRSDFPSQVWAKLYITGILASGVCWGSAGMLLFDPSHPELLLFLTLMLGGMAAGSIPILAPLLNVACAYLFIVMLPISFMYASTSGPLHWYMCFLTLFFLLVSLKTVRTAHRTIVMGALLKDQNNQLIRKLEQEREDVELLNEELKVALITAEDLAEAKDQFLATVSHELRTPMNAVIGMLDVVLSHEMPEEQKECLNVAQSSAKSLMSLINSVLDFSKIQTKDFSLIEEYFMPRTLLTDLETLFQARLREKNLQYFAIIDNELPEVVRGDSLRFRQVFINLIGNSIKFTNQNGVIILYALVNRKKGDEIEVEFAVADTGIGISESKTKLIFHSFTQAEMYTSRTYGGTGLGLTIVERLVTLMGGRINVRSKLGHGTRFNFCLCFPLLAEDEIENQLQQGRNDLDPAMLEGERKLNVLVAEDNKMNQMLMLKLLSTWGHSVTVASNGKEVVHTYEAEDFDIILMDCQMPVMDGYEATKTIRLREDSSNTRVPIIAVTAHARAGEFERCLASGMQDYITKPIDSKAFRRKLQELTDASKAK